MSEATPEPQARRRKPEPAATLAAALVAAQAEFPAVEPNAVNPHFKSKFVTLDHLIAKTRPILNKHGLAVTQEPSIAETGFPTLTTTLLHASGESRSSVMPLLLGKQDMQGLGAALTYAKRYAWSAALGISADEDDDGNSASQPAAVQAAAKPAAKPAETPQAAAAAASDEVPDPAERTEQHEKDFKAAKAIQRKLTDIAGPPDSDERSAFIQQFKASLMQNYGTEHISELDAKQISNLVARLREAEKAAGA